MNITPTELYELIVVKELTIQRLHKEIARLQLELERKENGDVGGTGQSSDKI